MGVVYLAEELSSGRHVALKVLLKDLSVSGEAFERFRREARLAAAISDSHCVFVFGAHEVDGAPAIAMELCAGQTLDQRIARGERIPIETAVRWTLEILEGLEAAHATGVIHRDVKPSNCFTTEDGHVKVGDFGLSRTLEPDVQLTQSGAFLGSPLYAAPEQIKGREVDVRSDLYSCGATLYALLTGKPPYSGSNIGEVLARILSEPPTPPREIRADIPVGLEKVVLRAMERDPKKRFQDHASFREALRPFARVNVEPARFTRRFIGYALDTALVSSFSTALMIAADRMGLDFSGFEADRPWVMKSVLFALALQSTPFLYLATCEGLFGAGFGKWILGQRVVAVSTGQPSLGRAAARTAMFALPSTLIYWACIAFVADDQQVFSLISSLLPVLVHVVFFATARKHNGYRAMHDLSTGMRVVQMASPLVRLQRAAPPPNAKPTAHAGLPARIGPYDIEGSLGRTPSGEVMQGRDPELQRGVWIHATSAEIDEQRRGLARPGRLRWLGQSHVDGRCYEVFEAPGGTSLRAWASSGVRMSWPMAQRYLHGLAEELAACESERHGSHYDAEQTWLDRNWNARLVDVSFCEAQTTKLDALGLFVQSARTVLADSSGDGTHGLHDVPAYADPIAERLLGRGEPYSSVHEIQREFAALSDRPAALTQSARATQMLLAVVAPSVLAAVILVMSLWIVPAIAGVNEARASMRVMYPEQFVSKSSAAQPDTVALGVGKLRVGLDTTGGAVPGTPAASLTPEQKNALDTLVVNGLTPPFGNQLLQRVDAEQRARFVEVQARRTSPSQEEVTRARQIAASLFDAGDSRDIEDARRLRYGIPAWSVPVLVTLWGVVATVASFFAFGGLTMRLCGIRVRSRKGPLASRMRCTWRALLAWVPLSAAYLAACYLMYLGSGGAAIAVFAITGLVHAAAIAHALWSPTRSIVDRIAGTTLVPR